MSRCSGHGISSLRSNFINELLCRFLVNSGNGELHARLGRYVSFLVPDWLRQQTIAQPHYSQSAQSHHLSASLLWVKGRAARSPHLQGPNARIRESHQQRQKRDETGPLFLPDERLRRPPPGVCLQTKGLLDKLQE